MKLRPYQEKLIRDARVKLREIRERLAKRGIERGPRLLIQLPTGGGKTAISAFITSSAVERGRTVRFNCHRDFLVDQTSGTYAKLGIEHSFIAAGRWMDQYTPVHVGMVQTVKNRLGILVPPNVCIWDECHHLGAASWSAIMDAWSKATHIGLSATPIRLDGKGLDAFFDDILIGPSVSWLIANGFLSDYIAYAPSSPDLTGVHTRMGDFKRDEIDDVMDRSVIIGDMVNHYRRLAPGRRAVYFCTSINHSEHTAAAFNMNGIRAIHLDGKHSTFDRQQAAKAFAHGDVQVLTNVDLFGEGYDLAAQANMDVTIEAVGLARPTQSLGLFMQQVGRALRPKDEKAIILDHAGNISRHGLPDDDREWSLKGIDKDKNGGASKVRQCEHCFAMIPVMTRTCPHCGTAKSVAEGGGRQVDMEDGELQEIDKDAVRKQRKIEEWTCESFDDLVSLGKRRGYKNPEGWAGHMWTLRERRSKEKERSAAAQMDFYERQGY